MRLQLAHIAFKPTFLFLFYLGYVLGMITFTLIFIFGADETVTTALYALPIFFVGWPVLLAIGIAFVNLLIRSYPWKITVIMRNVDENGNIVATTRHVRTIRTSRNQHVSEPVSKPDPALEPESEIFSDNSINDGDESGSQPLYGQQPEINKNPRESSDEYKAVTDHHSQKNHALSDPDSDDYQASTDRSSKQKGSTDEDSSVINK